MSDYQMIAFDMDGTLLNSKKEFLPSSIDMIQKAANAGKYVILNTGRGLSELKDFVDQVPGLRYLNCTSGASVYDWKEKKRIYVNPLPDEVTRQLMEIAQKEDIMLHMLYRESVVQRDHWERMECYGMGPYKGMFGQIAMLVDDIRSFYEEQKIPVEKLNLYHTSKESRERSRQRILDAGLAVSMANAEITSLEVSARNVDKGTGLKKLCEYLKIPLEEVIVVGDADNDLGAFRVAGLSIAMGNSEEHIKQIADVVVADCDHDGCAEAIQKYLL